MLIKFGFFLKTSRSICPFGVSVFRHDENGYGPVTLLRKPFFSGLKFFGLKCFLSSNDTYAVPVFAAFFPAFAGRSRRHGFVEFAVDFGGSVRDDTFRVGIRRHERRLARQVQLVTPIADTRRS